MKKTVVLTVSLIFGLAAIFGILATFMPREARADGVISFSDYRLEEAVRESLGIGDTEPITEEMALTLTYLDASSRGIESLDGLEYFTNLTSLNLGGNDISVISPLSGLTNLVSLDLFNNLISDIGSLADLQNLAWLDLGNNLIDNITYLANNSNLSWLNLEGNFLDDIMANLNDINWMDLQGNFLDIIGELSNGSLDRLNTWRELIANFSDLRIFNNSQNPPWPINVQGEGNLINNFSDLADYTWQNVDFLNNIINNLNDLPAFGSMPWMDFGSNIIDNFDSLLENTRTKLDLWNNILGDLGNFPALNNQPWWPPSFYQQQGEGPLTQYQDSYSQGLTDDTAEGYWTGKYDLPPLGERIGRVRNNIVKSRR